MEDAQEAVLVEETGVGSFQVRVRTRETAFFADEPAQVGGLGSGPDPFELVSAALAACTIMTMRLYARRKGWRMARLSSSVRHWKASPGSRDRFERVIRMDPRLEPDKQARLLHIADRCPVHRMLECGANITTRVGTSDLPFPVSAALHGKIIQELCTSEEASDEAA
jgi:putative redox protein